MPTTISIGYYLINIFWVIKFLIIFYYRPDTQTYIQRLEQEKAEKLRGDKTDNRSFFAKYVNSKFK
jgi:hypothetical protein